jgi:nicotinate-nucleotide adenylyltransferase
LFVPAAHPPHRTNGTLASYEDRFQMVQLACKEDSRFEASRIEEGAAPSYSIHTIEKVRAGTNCDSLYFLIGADAFADIGTWFRWRDVVSAVTFIVVSRPGAKYDVPEGARALRLEDVELNISSSEIRKSIKNQATGGSACPTLVAGYIQKHQLYR